MEPYHETAVTQRSFIETFHSRGYQCLPSFSLLGDNPTVLFVNASVTPFLPRMLQGAPLARTALVQRCFRAHDDPAWLFVFHMLGILAEAADLDQVTAHLVDFLVERAGLEPGRLHTVIDREDRELERAITLRLGSERLHHQRGNTELHWTRWHFGRTSPLVGAGLTLCYERAAATACSPGCDVSCACGRYSPFANVIVMSHRHLERRYVDIGVGLESLVAATGDGDFFSLSPLREAVAALAPLAGDRAKARELANAYLGVTALVDAGIQPGPRRHQFVLRKLIRAQVAAWLGGPGSPAGDETILAVRRCQAALAEALGGWYAPQLLARVGEVMEGEARGYLENLARTWDRLLRRRAELRRTPPAELAPILRETYGLPERWVPALLALVSGG